MVYHEVIVTHVDSPGKFYVQFAKFEAAYETFLNKLKADLRARGSPKHDHFLPIGEPALIYKGACYKVGGTLCTTSPKHDVDKVLISEGCASGRP